MCRALVRISEILEDRVTGAGSALRQARRRVAGCQQPVAGIWKPG